MYQWFESNALEFNGSTTNIAEKLPISLMKASSIKDYAQTH